VIRSDAPITDPNDSLDPMNRNSLRRLEVFGGAYEEYQGTSKAVVPGILWPVRGRAAPSCDACHIGVLSRSVARKPTRR